MKTKTVKKKDQKMNAADRVAAFMRAQQAPCLVDGCDVASVAKGFCRYHYDRARAGRPLAARVKK